MAASERNRAHLDALIGLAESDASGLKRVLGPVQLTALGIATIVGAGIFVLAGQAAAEYAGPGVVISFVLAGIAASLAALCYVELAGAVPVAGSTYTYAYAAVGPLVGWITGWTLLLEYLLGGSTVAVGWSGYFENVLSGVGIDLPKALESGAFDGGVVNLPAVLMIALVSWLLMLGVSESARAATVLVTIKLVVLALFVGLGAFYVTKANLTPFVPPNEGGFGEFGATGVIRAAGIVFYAYIGFDVVCTAAQEARNPRRTVPIGVLGSLAAATIIYVLVGLVLTGIVDYRTLGVADPLSAALQTVSALDWLRGVIDVGAVAFLAATVLATLYGQTRILMRMSDDGMLPAGIGRVTERYGTPRTATILCGGAAMVIAGLFPITTLADLVSAGTLIAFLMVAVAVIVLRRNRPDLERNITLPFGYAIPILTIAVTASVLVTLPATALLRAAVWIAVGLGVFALYGRARSERVIDRRIAEAAGGAS